jgi:hypothetical protein
MDSKCQEPAVFRYTWPGNEEKFICVDHAAKLLAISQAMGLTTHLYILLSDDLLKNIPCSQNVKEPQP